VSKQVLLALSPLHHQLLPPAEVAHLLPSSFAPAVGKALMQQVLRHTPVPVLAGFQHKHAQLHMWHVWWHVGLRRYQWQQQQQAQGELHKLAQGEQLQNPRAEHERLFGSSRGGGDGSVVSLSPGQFYLDADAR
jgi:hypothetical protein